MEEFHDAPYFKIVLIGDKETGKTTFLKRNLTGEFDTNYMGTKGVEIHILQFDTNRGPMQFQAWDTAGQEGFDVLDEGCYINAQGAIVFYDVSRPGTFKNVSTWLRNLKRNCGTIPTVLCGNKADFFRTIKQTPNNDFNRKMNLQCISMSVKNCFNFNKPFQWLSRVLFGDPGLTFVEPQAFKLPRSLMAEQWCERVDLELLNADKSFKTEDDEDHFI